MPHLRKSMSRDQQKAMFAGNAQRATKRFGTNVETVAIFKRNNKIVSGEVDIRNGKQITAKRLVVIRREKNIVLLKPRKLIRS